MVAYGAFFQLILPLGGGVHASIAIERSGDPPALVEPARSVLAERGLQPAVEGEGPAGGGK